VEKNVVLIDLFEVAPGREEEFLGFYRRISAYVRRKSGFLGNRLHRSPATDARYRFVNVVEWASEQDCRNGHDEGFQALVGPSDRLPFTSTPRCTTWSGTTARPPRPARLLTRS
jgi:heme oxygenase (mycobilin-producing)